MEVLVVWVWNTFEQISADVGRISLAPKKKKSSALNTKKNLLNWITKKNGEKSLQNSLPIYNTNKVLALNSNEMENEWRKSDK